MSRAGPLILALLCLALISADKPTPPPDNAPADFLDVPEWWGSYTVTIRAQQHQAGQKDWFTWHHDMHAFRQADGSFHLDKPMNGGILPGHTADKPDLAALMDKHRLRTWTNANELRKGPTTARVVYDGDSSNHHDDPVEGKAVDTFGDDSHFSEQADVKSYTPVMLVIDLKQKVYGLTFPYDTVDSRELKGKETKHEWEKRFDGTTADSSKTFTVTGVHNQPKLPTDAHHRPEWIVDQPLPDKVGPLKGTLTYDVPYGSSKENIAHVEITWFLSPTPPEDLELILAPGDDTEYDKWRPWGGITPNGPSEDVPGRNITVVAKLQKKGGGEPKESCNNITFKLQQVSREPGLCMNWPLATFCKDQPDLQFVPAENLHTGAHRVIDTNLAVATADHGKLTMADVVVSSFDYGAFGLVEAKCQLESGRELTAHLKTDEGKYSLRIPKSREGSHIAESWREKYHAQGDDTSDDENSPVGDGHKGDGFTLFEEYRGYYGEDGFVHLDMDPNVKDFFVVNHCGDDTEPGIREFERVSKLKVHRLTDICHDHRLVNFNRSPWASRTEQHCVLIEQGGDKEASETVGGPSTPKYVQWILMVDMGGFTTDSYTIAHELFHACDVWHHGEHDNWHAIWVADTDLTGDLHLYPADAGTIKLNPDGTVASASHDLLSSHIKLYRESKPTVEVLPHGLQKGEVITAFIGMPHGQHSGDEGCHMRYQCAYAYPKDPNKLTNEFFVTDPAENSVTHDRLCTDPSGHVFNNLDRLPRPRYYEADTAAKRGDCAHQILVNDAVPPTSRLSKNSTK